MPEPSTPAATKATAQTRDAAPRPADQDSPSYPRGFPGLNVSYTLGPGVARAAAVAAYERRPDDPVYRPLRIYTLDPAALALEGATTVLRVPYEPLQPGPRGYLFRVDGADGDGPVEEVDLDDPPLLITQGRSPSPSDHLFHQQMAYAVSSSVYATFRAALGRRLAWGFDCPDADGSSRLTLRVHHAATGANAAYHRDRGEIRFGYFPLRAAGAKGRHVPDGLVYTCLSHDIIVHEVAHALIDGMRSHFIRPTCADVLGFHEGFADLIAILQHFSYQQVLESEIRKSGNRLRKATLLLGIAHAFGLSVGLQGALRSAEDGATMTYDDSLEPHQLGAVLVSAVFDAFQVIYDRKTERLLRLAGRSRRENAGELSADLIGMLAREASKLASQFLSICVRALDYCPPVDVRLGEFLRAMITADRDLVPDDPWSYREALIDAFAARGIYPEHVPHLSEDALVWRGLLRPLDGVAALSFAELKFAGDPASPASRNELERQACALGEVVTRPENLELFGLVAPWDDRLLNSRAEPPCVQSIRTSRRVGPDGQILFDLVAEVTQSRFVHDRTTGAECEFTGGATVILGPAGDFRYVVVKSVMNRTRLERQLEYQRSTAFWARRGGQMVPATNPLHLVHDHRRECLCR